MRIANRPAPVSLPLPEEPEPLIPPRASFPRFVETTAEILWACLLVLVIGFFVSKASVISRVFDEAASAFHRSGEPAARASEAQIQDLELRMAAEERKLSTLERGYAQLKERHADLQRAYADLQEQARAQTGGGTIPLAAVN
jgi:hypothetical protein